MKKLKTTSIVVRNSEGKYLGVSRKDNYKSWGFAGGKCEGDEEPLDCAIRELQEETGLIAKSLRLLDVRDYINHYNQPPTEDEVYLYEVTEYEGKLHTEEYLKEQGEGMVKWVYPEVVCYGFFGDYNKVILKEFFDLKTIWLVKQHTDWEGSDVLAIFSTEKGALKYAKDFTDFCNEEAEKYGWKSVFEQSETNSNCWIRNSEAIEVVEDFIDTEFIKE